MISMNSSNDNRTCPPTNAAEQTFDQTKLNEGRNALPQEQNNRLSSDGSSGAVSVSHLLQTINPVRFEMV